MGPRGLSIELRRLNAFKTLRGPSVEQLLEGKAVAVDAAIWLYEAQMQQNLLQHYGPIGAVVKVMFDFLVPPGCLLGAQGCLPGSIFLYSLVSVRQQSTMSMLLWSPVGQCFLLRFASL